VRELLGPGTPDVSYADLVLILSAVISASAALRWPGRSIDRQRFVELLVRESPEEYHLSWISVPALIDMGYVSESDTAYGKPGQSTRIFQDEEIDCTYADARNTYAALLPKTLKQCSYAALIYEWLRCGYAHEYSPHKNITHVPASRHDARISYIGRGTPQGVTRMISFHLDYMIRIAEYHATNAAETPEQLPPEWWAEIA
jgi:hypothetical protein